jgi:hypothetical protein
MKYSHILTVRNGFKAKFKLGGKRLAGALLRGMPLGATLKGRKTVLGRTTKLPEEAAKGSAM